MSRATKEVLLEPEGHRLGVIRTHGDVVHEVGEALAWVIVESGGGRLRVNGESVDVGGRAGVFDGPGWSAVAPAGATVATEGTVTATIVFRYLWALAGESTTLTPSYDPAHARLTVSEHR